MTKAQELGLIHADRKDSIGRSIVYNGNFNFN